ncbi:MAG: hypothetical protein ACTIDN_06410 [Acetobacter sp.]|uniref:hypothetical protein n=1 Tax=Acetobacter sp. TaxID=440 RepID=UPI003F8FC815
MARKSVEKQILAMATDIRLQALGHTAMGVWFQLMAFICEMGFEGSVTFGVGRIPALSDVAAIGFRMSVDELKTHIKTQCETQLLAWDDASETLSFGPEQQPSRRTLANRANGAKGGRPPKLRITERTDPAQKHLPPMAIQGGKTMETQKTHAPIAKLANKTNTNLALAKQAEPSKEAIDALFNVLGPKAFEAAGFDPARDMGNWSAVRQWVADGLAKGLTAEEIERLVLSVVADVADRQRASGKPASHLGYFKKAVQAAIASGAIPAPVLTVADQIAERECENAIKDWARNGCNGPAPKVSDFVKKAAAA